MANRNLIFSLVFDLFVCMVNPTSAAVYAYTVQLCHVSYLHILLGLRATFDSMGIFDTFVC